MSEKIAAMQQELRQRIRNFKKRVAELEAKGQKSSPELDQEFAATLYQLKQLRDQVADEKARREGAREEDLPSRKTFYGIAESPAKRRPRWGSVKNFDRGSRRESEEAAYRFAKWFAGSVLGDGASFNWCRENGIKVMQEVGSEFRELKTMKESVNSTGGYLVPPEFDADLIDLRESFGVFRRFARIVPMMRETKTIGRRTGGLTAYAATEAAAVAESEKSWDTVELVAKKFMTLTRVSSELNEDIMVTLGDDLAGEIAYAFSRKEDDCGFNGDGSSTYHGIIGVREKIKGLDSTIGNIAGLVVASGNTYSEIVLADFNKVVGMLPEYAETPRAAWFCSKFFWASVMQRLTTAVGGVMAEEIEGRRMRMFLGYPVIVSQVMPKVEANSQVCALLGDLRLAAAFGDRRQTTISMSEHRYFDTDEIGVKGTERYDIVVHDVGNASATAADREPGPIVGLITAAA